MLVGENGILKQASNAKKETEKAQNGEQIVISQYEDFIDQIVGNGMTKEVQGTYINIKDASPNQHELDVTLTSDTVTDFSSVNIFKYGSNLLDISKMLQSNFIDNGDGTFTFTRTEDAFRSGYADVNIPAGVPFYFGATLLDVSTLSETDIWAELLFSDESREYVSFVSKETSTHKKFEYDKSITKIRFFVRDYMMNIGDYIKFEEPRINIGELQAYEQYVEPQIITSNKDGIVKGFMSISPNMTLISDNKDIEIKCKYTAKYPKYNLYGKTIVNFGDSIFGNFREPEDISTYIEGYTGATVYNIGFGGTRMSTHSEYWNTLSMFSLADAITTKNFQLQDEAIANNVVGNSKFPTYFSETISLLKNIDFNNVDIITIAYGTNDFTSDKEIDNEANPMDTSTISGALRYSIETIKKTYPNIQIVICTPIYRFWMDENNVFLYDSDTYENAIGVKLTDIVQAEKNVGSSYNLLVIDNYYNLDINKNSYSKYFSGSDGTHPNSVGRKLMAEHIAQKLYQQFR